MKISSSPFLSILLTALLLLHLSAASTTNETEFIRVSCQGTLYPELCYTTLSGYASIVQEDPGRLACMAIGVSLTTAKHVAAYLQAGHQADPRTAVALHDCFSVFDETVYQLRQSLHQMEALGGSSEDLRFQISNEQTWMSAAETYEDTCVDGFEGAPDGPLKSDVCARVANVMQLTSNAMALVNSFANKISTT